MRWFKHMSDSHTDEKLAMVQAELGFEGYGLYWFLLEVIAKQMDAENDKTFVEYPTNFWQRLTGLYPNKFKRLVNVLEKFELLSANFCKKSIRIDCPNLLKYRDEWSRKKGRNSGATPEPLRSKETETDTETEEEVRSTLLAEGACRQSESAAVQPDEENPEDGPPGSRQTQLRLVENGPAPEPTPATSTKSVPSQAKPPEGGNGKRDGPPPCPHREIIALYHEILPELPRVRVWEGQREVNLRARWRADPDRQSLDWWRRFFEYISRSPFLMGAVDPKGDRDKAFVASLDWIVRPNNFAKIIEGRYAA